MIVIVILMILIMILMLMNILMVVGESPMVMVMICHTSNFAPLSRTICHFEPGSFLSLIVMMIIDCDPDNPGDPDNQCHSQFAILIQDYFEDDCNPDPDDLGDDNVDPSDDHGGGYDFPQQQLRTYDHAGLLILFLLK